MRENETEEIDTLAHKEKKKKLINDERERQ